MTRPFNICKEMFKSTIAKAYKQSNPNIFFHFSLTKFNKLKDINNGGGVSFFLSKPDEESIKLLRKNGFYNYGKPKDSFYIYSVDLNKNKNKIQWYYIASIPEEENMLNYSDYRKESYKGRARLMKRKYGIEVFFTKYEDMAENIDLNWLNFSHFSKLQIEKAKTYPEYKSLYASNIPHLICGVEKGTEFDIESVEIVTP